MEIPSSHIAAQFACPIAALIQGIATRQSRVLAMDPITRDEAEMIARWITQNPWMIRKTPDALLSHVWSTFIRRGESGEVIAFCTGTFVWKYQGAPVWKIGSFVISPDHCGNGIGNNFLSDVSQAMQLTFPNAILVIITQDRAPWMIRIAQANKFEQLSRDDHPKLWEILETGGAIARYKRVFTTTLSADAF